MPEIIDRIIGTIGGGGRRPAFVFSDIDEVGPLADHSIGHFVTLAARARSPVIITSRAEAGTKWATSPDIRVESLRPFESSEVREFAALSRELASLTTGQLDALVHGMSSGALSIDADLVYDVLQAVAP